MSTRPLAVVILAAGKGTRMKSDKPKVMHEVAGKPMVNWVIDAAAKLNPDKIITVIGPQMPELEQAVAPYDFVVQNDRNGTGGAVKCALSKLKGFDGDVLVLLGDCPLLSTKTLKALVKAKNKDMLTRLSVLGMEIANPTGYGRLILSADGSVIDIREEKDVNAKEKLINIVNAGAFCIEGGKLEYWIKRIKNNNAQGELYLTDLPKIAASNGAVCALTLCSNPDEAMGCNTRNDLAHLEKTMQRQLRAKLMQSGVTLHDPDTVYVHYDTKVGIDTIVEPNVYFGPGVKIEKNVYIKANSYFEGCVVKQGATIGPFARLRPDTKVEKDARIGNFVEIKKSTIGARSKIGHLAYVGDCKMGEDVNFSAGAITVNYDGFQKHQTVIGKGVMVGSNVNLVAPVSIDNGAFIAAGSTITENVPADALSIARDAAEIRQGWAARYRKMKEAAKRKKMQKKKAS
ncbi:MAG: bifunctional N-acetylglucosamine-1-phosphate uridyltransferase/glucosamine-1-phosphate acetyltransferase [Micavibrio sp.]|nr:bifunctional N-acetylglucosamine-1-phosphate uridyltransferase/glucosamine-1-phosphate acetyltransferase [Micavibrio sp.]